jgi:hypothetical protein
MLSYLLFIAAIISSLFFPNVIVDDSSPSSGPITLGTICNLYMIIAIIIFIYRRRETPFYGKLWQLISLFFTILFATLLGGYIKEQIKKKDYSAAFFGLMIPFLWFINKTEKSKKPIRKKSSNFS